MSDVVVPDLLPPNTSSLEREMARTLARVSNLSVPIVASRRAAVAPPHLLAWLAWEMSVDSWDATWSGAQKRSAVTSSPEVHRRKGSAQAVRQALRALGYQVQVQEWFQQIPHGAPYTYSLHIESRDVGIDQIALSKIYRVIDVNKSLRSHLARIFPRVITTAGPRVAAVASVGVDLVVKFGGGNLVSDGTASSLGTYKSHGLRVES